MASGGGLGTRWADVERKAESRHRCCGRHRVLLLLSLLVLYGVVGFLIPNQRHPLTMTTSGFRFQLQVAIYLTANPLVYNSRKYDDYKYYYSVTVFTYFCLFCG